ncbi:MAG: 50S ribosomal protein L1 [Bacteroidales bacterium OttesenSCG-928-I14]|jgi:large subunit ribosomal protein L1|nr:50S ribosomal protein L1 [Bacteroidales bacterium OttesenSCG-928-I14]
MSKLTRNRKAVLNKIEIGKIYSIQEASVLIKQITITKFDSSVDIDVCLGIDTRKSNQIVRGVVSLPYGTGREIKILALVTSDNETVAKDAGADYVGLDEYIEKIKNGWTDIDVIVTQPSIMGRIGILGKILGPKGLMPNPKVGTVTNDVGIAVEELKKGKIEFKADKAGVIHASIGRVSFTSEQICDNVKEFVTSLIKVKPSASKGPYIKNIYLSSTMSPSLNIDFRSIDEN